MLVIKPSLAKTLLAVFSLIVLIEAFFIGVLCFDILRMEAAAKREFDGARNTQTIYQVMNSFAGYLELISAARNNPGSQPLARRADRVSVDFDRDLDPALQMMSSLGVEANSLDRLRATTNKVFYYYRHFDDSVDKPTKIKQKLVAVKSLGSCYKFLIGQLQQIQDALRQPPEIPVLGIAPEHLLILGAFVNIACIVGLFSFVERKLSRPLSQLIEACALIRQRLPLEHITVSSSEIGVLQNSFQLMAAKVIENEKRRKGYLVLFQTVQLNALSKVNKILQSLSTSNDLLGAVKSRVEKCLASLTMLKELLSSMSEQLESTDPLSIKIHPVVCSSKTLLNETAASVEILLQNRHVTLETDHEEQRFVADPQLVSRVILNLISNAIKYSPDGGKVKVSVSAKDEALEFNVIDSGPGISSEGQLQLFKRFSQLESSDGVKRAGTGLGLAICKDFIDAHGGEIGCVSSPGSGSNFWFRIPLQAKVVPASVTSGGGGDISGRDARALGQGAVSTSAAIGGGAKSVALEKESVKSIKIGFGLLLTSFVCTQVLIFVVLSGLFAESTQRTMMYAQQKSQFLETENRFLAHVQWSNRLNRAYLANDLAGMRLMLPQLKEQRLKLSQLSSMVDQGSDLQKALIGIGTQQKELVEEMDYALQHLEQILDGSLDYKNTLTDRIHILERSWKEVLALENNSFNSSYDFSKDVRSKILAVLILAALADLLLLAACAFLGLKIVGKILILKLKTETFSAGARITSSLSGRDELCFLDQRLCQVANEIHDAEAKRQELLSIINHDLRTPLSSVMGAMDNIAAGVYGELADDDYELVEHSTEVLDGLMNQINDLLLLEKIESGSFVPSCEDVHVFEIIVECVRKAAHFAEERNVRISVIPDSDSSRSDVVLADRMLVSKAISIVLKNAVAASENSGEVEICMTRSENENVVRVKNAGNAVSPELLPQIFERFRFLGGEPLAGFGLPLASQSCRVLGASICLVQSDSASTIVELKFPGSRMEAFVKAR